MASARHGVARRIASWPARAPNERVRRYVGQRGKAIHTAAVGRADYYWRERAREITASPACDRPSAVVSSDWIMTAPYCVVGCTRGTGLQIVQQLAARGTP